MNIQLKNPSNLPFVFFLMIGLILSLVHPFAYNYVETFVIGLLITLLLFGVEGLKELFDKMKAPFWFPLFVFIMLHLIDSFYMTVARQSTGNGHLFDHTSIHHFANLHGLFEKVWVAGRFLFSAVNEELLMIPIVLMIYNLLKRTRTGWYIASFCSAILFAFLHFTVYELNAWIFVGLVFGRLVFNELFRLTGSIRAPMYVHFLNDATVLLVWML